MAEPHLTESPRRRLWTEREREIVRELYPDTPTATIAEKLGRSIGQVYQVADRLGLKKSEAYLASPAARRLRRGDNVGAAFRFKKGQTPANKGLRRPGWAPGRMKETQFKKGQLSGKAAENWQPIGSIRQDAEGYLRIKVRDALPGEAYGYGNTKVWPLLNRHIWEQHNGPIPKGHAVVFRDGNRQNCEIGNLELVSRQELMRRNTYHRYGKEISQLIQLRGALNRQINKREGKHGTEKQDAGSSQPSL